MFQNVRFRLLLSYLLVMEGILILFAGSVYLFLSREKSKEINSDLMALAEVVAPTFTIVSVSDQKSSHSKQFDQREVFNAEIQSRQLFDPNIQSIEWFDGNKKLLLRQGQESLKVSSQPKPGLFNLASTEHDARVRSVTLSIAVRGSELSEPYSQGYIRINQSLEELETYNNQLLLILSLTAIGAFTLAVVGGYFLTDAAVKPAEEAFKKQKQFTANASHELRGPLTAIKASIDLMRRHPERFEAKDNRKVGAISKATDQMIRLVEDLLFLARTEKKNTKDNLEYESIVVNDLLERLVDLLEPLAEQKNITLSYQPFHKVFVIGNEDELIRLFSNLLHNALNYTPENGFVLVFLQQHNHSVKVFVDDTGVGIASEDIPRVFDRFWRADKARNSSGGSGLGLSIAQSIAHSHQGNITVSSTLGVGTRFEVSLPIL
ncbi:sensor histidine kinase [Crocosphaera sp. Alani8]|uniref:sensor histidine kinase n=1 Tax=Crocosphaera sp. Alani8 TaxID=3038952 RepID=UPI00313B647C